MSVFFRHALLRVPLRDFRSRSKLLGVEFITRHVRFFRTCPTAGSASGLPPLGHCFVVGDTQRGRAGAGRLRVLRCPCAVVSQQRVHLHRGVVGQQGCCYSGVSARRGVAVCRDAQRVVAVGQRSRERSPQMQVANDVTSAKLQGGELREDCVEGALERGLAGRERGVCGV